MEVRVFLHHHAQIRIVFREHERASAHRVPVQRDIALLHSWLTVEFLGLPGHRREKRHGQPVHQLRILSMDADSVGITVIHRQAGKINIPQILPDSLRAVFVTLTYLFSKRIEADDVLAHYPGNG